MDELDDDWQSLSHDSLLAKRDEEIRLQAAKQVSRLEKANAIVKQNVIYAITAGLIPMPLLDVVALTNIQFRMLDDLVKLYNLRYTRIEKSVVKAFLLGVLPVVTVTGLSSFLKVMPGIGTFTGSTGVAISAGGLTYATGKVFIQHFEAGGTLDNFNIDEAKRRFRREFLKGKKIAQNLAAKKQLPLIESE